MRNKFDLIIFDWDGTLIDSIDWIVSCIQHAAKICQNNIPTDKEAKDVIGLSLSRAITQLFPGIDEQTQIKLASCYSEKYFSRQIVRDDLFTGVYDMLTQLRSAGFKLAVATGKSRSGLNSALCGTETEELFCASRCADETASKPDPVMLNEIIDELDTANERTLMVGDSVHDLQMAKNAGIAAIAVACGVHSREMLQPYQPLRCLQQTTEILELLERGKNVRKSC